MPLTPLPLLLVIALCQFAVAALAAPDPIDLQKTKVIVCAGDSITDGQTYSLMVAQALKAAHHPVPLFIPAGIGGDTSAGILARLDRDVLSFHPDLVMVQCGINDVASGVTTKDFTANLEAIVARLQQAHTRVMLFTLTTVRAVPRYDEDPKRLDSPFLSLEAATLIMRRVAEKNQLPLADCARVMGAAPAGSNLWEDGAHLNFNGYRLMSRAILDGLGCPDAEPPATFADYKLAPLPGIITHWRIHPVAKDEKLPDEHTAATVTPDDTWKPYTLPETDSVLTTQGWWFDQERQRGFALQLATALGKADRYLCYAVIKERRARTLYLNTGGGLDTAYLNGIRINTREYTTGWHAGGHRIPVTLNKGKNILLLVTENRFFCSLTDSPLWW